jgi:DnaJ-class molecular chaperone
VTDHIDDDITDCPECEGMGWVYCSELAHAPDCTGDCGSYCPVEVMGQRACPSCNGSGVEWVPPPSSPEGKEGTDEV